MIQRILMFGALATVLLAVGCNKPVYEAREVSEQGDPGRRPMVSSVKAAV